MSPVNSLSEAYRIFDAEIQWMQQNTDGLIVDVMRNTGGYIIYGHELARRLIPTPFQGVGFELRATWSRLQSVYSDWQFAKLMGASPEVLQMWESVFNEVQTAYLANRGRTNPIPLGMPSLDLKPATSAASDNIAYTKPLVVVIDDFSFSTADLFPALIQDAGRGPLVGKRTGGGGGTNTSFLAATYAEASTGMTMGLMVRPKDVAYEGYPATRYIENVGVRPDIELDLMTRENLMNGGQTFRDKLIELILAEIAKQSQGEPK
jgi:C-terminal processing protease CtpA/Prc